jgi:predicted CXXCH cytochrome family protein
MLHGLTRMGGMIRSFVVLFIFALSGSAGLFADVAKPQIPASRGAQCVEPVEIMRRNHFEFIVHQRDLTVHQGIRTKRHSLAGCIDCHSTKTAAGQYLPVNAEGEFCQTCHTYAAVKIDCFSCHAAVPTEKISQSP